MAKANLKTRNQDALPAIRGYVYQFQFSILRWLQLTEKEELELESGEDLAQIWPALSSVTSLEMNYRLEQIKHSVRPITLRSEQTRTAIANAILHRQMNPDSRLTFRFTTNASRGVEQKSPFTDKQPGIDVWERVRTSGAIESCIADLRSLKTLLWPIKSIKDASADSWTAYEQFLSRCSEREFYELIRVFEWSRADEFANLGPSICGKLIGDRHVVDDEEARRVFGHLFLYITRMLCTKSRPRLTLKLLKQEIRAAVVVPSDAVLLARLSPPDFLRLHRKVVYKENRSSHDPFGLKVCPDCGLDEQDLKFSSGEADGDEVYYFVECPRCKWSEYTQ